MPLPWPGICGVAKKLAIKGDVVAALGVMLAANTYLRPGELLHLCSIDVIPPRPQIGEEFRHVSLLLSPAEVGKPTKTHQFNDSVLMDSVGREWLGKAVLLLA